MTGPTTCARRIARDTVGGAQVDVVKRNTGLKNLQDDYFFFRTSVGGVCVWALTVLQVAIVVAQALLLSCPEARYALPALSAQVWFSTI